MFDTFVELGKEFTEAPEIFLEASKYYLISDTLGVFHRAIADVNPRLNVFIVLSSPPATHHRSTVKFLTKIVQQEAYKEFFRLNETYYEIEDVEKIANERILGTGSPEGLIDQISDLRDEHGINFVTIHGTEFGMTLREVFGKKYMEGVGKLLSTIYDGDSYSLALSRRTQQRTVHYLPQGTYCTMLSEMQEFYKYITEEMFDQGLVRRLLIIYKKGKPERSRPPIDMELRRDDIIEELRELGRKIGEKMNEIKERAERRDVNEYTPVAALGNIADKMIKIDQTFADARDYDNPTYGDYYIECFRDYFRKLTYLNAIANDRLVGGKMIIPKSQDIKEAMKFIAKVRRTIEPEFSLIGTTRTRVRDVKSITDLIISKIKEATKTKDEIIKRYVKVNEDGSIKISKGALNKLLQRIDPDDRDKGIRILLETNGLRLEVDREKNISYFVYQP